MIKYWVDKKGIIVSANQTWDAVAEQENADALKLENIVGKNILSFFNGDGVKLVYYSTIQHIYSLKSQTVIKYRCDTPNSAREMEMRVVYDDEQDLIRLESKLLHEYPQEKTRNFQTVPESPNLRCSVCNHVQIEGEWIDPFEIDDSKFEEGNLSEVVYVICESCEDKFCLESLQ